MRDRLSAHFKPSLLEFLHAKHPDAFRLDGLVHPHKVIAAAYQSGSAAQRQELVEATFRYLVANDINAWQRLRDVEAEYLVERELQGT